MRHKKNFQPNSLIFSISLPVFLHALIFPSTSKLTKRMLPSPTEIIPYQISSRIETLELSGNQPWKERVPMTRTSKLVVILFICISLLIIGVTPAFGYSNWYSGSQFSAVSNGFFNPGTIFFKNPNQYSSPYQKYQPPKMFFPTPIPITPPTSVNPPSSAPANGLSAEESKWWTW